ncbi:CamS family sex pheromone protein [Metabacillus sp. RGM 3146]|uniref:CamS family sex pheromone protein n=1 Tax=Metabacillus sp. RGM 3146 TaxID=3401092 RepID=UPI003B997153
MLMLSACTPNFGNQDEVVKNTETDSKQKAFIPKYNISDSYYKTILPFTPSKARGLTASRLNTRYDVSEFETGLMRIAQESFPADKYVYQEGQKIDKNVISGWLGSELSGKELANAQKDKKFVNGLNPPQSTGTDKKNPAYLASVMEQDYLAKKDQDTVELGGVVIGLALNSIDYSRDAQFNTHQTLLDDKTVRAEGEKIADKVLQQVRQTNGLENVPIVIGLYKQAPKSSIVPGNFIAKAEARPGSSNLGNWNSIDDRYYFFPSAEATSKYRDDAQNFSRFKDDVATFFPNYTGVVGKAFYKGGEMKSLKIDIPMQFYGKAEVIAFTQFITGKVVDYFPNYIDLEVNISSTDGPEALIVRNAGQDKPDTHIYQ